jgi:hypothetical protein
MLDEVVRAIDNGAVRRLAERLKTTPFSVVALSDGTGVLLDLNGMQVLTLNETGSFVVSRLLEGAVSLESLAAAVATVFQIDEGAARRDVSGFLERLTVTTSSAAAGVPEDESNEREDRPR